MPITSVHKDPDALTMTVTTEFAAPIERAWQLWADPRQLERWWGPPTFPATFVDHDLRPGGRISYYMTGPEGEQPRGWWNVVAVDPPHSLEVVDGFADDAGAPNPEMPTMVIRMRMEPLDEGRTRMAIETTFPSLEAMEQLVAMGMEQGMAEALGQIDALVAA